MAEEQKTIKVDVDSPAVVAPAKEPTPAPVEVSKDVAEEKVHTPLPDESKALTVVEKPIEEPTPKKSSAGSVDRDVKLADLEKEKKTSFIKAWEESEKSKAEHKAQKKISDVLAWENSKKAATEAQLRKIEEKLEKKKAEYGEKMKNKVAAIHKEAEEKRAMVEAKKGEELLKAEEMAAKYRATGVVPKANCGCF
ncbi:Remorin [Raphanus sativus]|uniref:Remorin n=1 Tax=Raphanus sativus TaxID=3726 RepID=A0A6J0JZ11_RAPSA|nr:remorin [Raphanus sativus]KAJ4892398.1 Remorin [Raphanus sativus]